MEARFEQFIQEKKYLANVSAATCEWCTSGLRWLPSPAPDEAGESHGDADAPTRAQSVFLQPPYQGHQFLLALEQRRTIRVLHGLFPF